MFVVHSIVSMTSLIVSPMTLALFVRPSHLRQIHFALEAVLNEVDTGQTLGHATWVNVSATWRFGR